ncbi:17033_t:CDS:2 [Rhizophagus irregularis]|nr:17033_t:CDS:2 [Rhizophagus irregularis]
MKSKVYIKEIFKKYFGDHALEVFPGSPQFLILRFMERRNSAKSIAYTKKEKSQRLKERKRDVDSLSPTLDHPDPSFPTLKLIDFNSIQQSGEFWEMIHTDDNSDNNSNDKKNFGTMLYFTPVWFNKAYNKFGPHLYYTNKENIDQKYKNKEWYEICYLKICMNVVFRTY